MTYVLEASSVLRLLDKEAGSERVAEVVREHLAGTANVIISAAHWGEILFKFFQRYGINTSGRAISELDSLQFVVVPATKQRAVRSAAIKAQYKMPYVDCFAVELAESSDATLIPADFDYVPAKDDIPIEFLPPKPRL